MSKTKMRIRSQPRRFIEKARPPKKPKLEDIETEPGAEERFERTVRRMLNTPSRQHQEDVGKKPKPKKSKPAK